MYDNARLARAAYTRARQLRERLAHGNGANATALAEKVDALAPAGADSDARRDPRAPKPEGPPTLKSVGDDLMAAAMSMQGADITPTADQIAACRRASAAYRTVMAQWTALETRARGALTGN